MEHFGPSGPGAMAPMCRGRMKTVQTSSYLFCFQHKASMSRLKCTKIQMTHSKALVSPLPHNE